MNIMYTNPMAAPTRPTCEMYLGVDIKETPTYIFIRFAKVNGHVEVRFFIARLLRCFVENIESVNPGH